MKSNKIKDLYSKIDLDPTMDQRIQNHLLHKATAYKEGDRREAQHRGSEERFSQYSGHRVSLIRILASVVLSVSVFILVAVMLYGFKSAMVYFNDSWRKTVSSDGSGDLAENQDDMRSSEDSNPVSDNPDAEDDVIVEQPENTDEEPVSGNDDAGDTGETGEGSSQDGNTNGGTGDVEEEGGSTTDNLPEEEPGNAGNEPTVNDEKMPDEEAEAENYENTLPAENTTPESSTAPFYFAHFDVYANSNEKISIPYLVIRLHGTVSTINPADLTDVVLTRDGVIVNNSVKYTGKYNSFKWSYEEVTDFYFKFAYDNVEPGTYGLTGKYQGESFKVYEKIIEAQISDTPADVDALSYVTWMYSTDANDNVTEVSELVFQFRGHQNTFYQSDITELKAFQNGQEIPLELNQWVIRYYESDGKGSGNTSYNLFLKNSFKASGSYKITGKYRGKDFKSIEIVIP